jgi:DNA (cytosine-5)-methyltransferase 1
MIALDLFAGTGWGVACQQLGITEHGVENMPEAQATRTAAGMHLAYSDVWDGLFGRCGTGNYKLLIGSPPCQTFSIQGNGKGTKALGDVVAAVHAGRYKDPWSLFDLTTELDPRTALVLTPLAHVWRDRPEYVVLEQVPQVMPVWNTYASVMRGLGYDVAVGMVQAERYGVPQTRKRAILVARRDGEEARLPQPTHSRFYPRDPERMDFGVQPWVSMADALGWGLSGRPSPTITGGGTETGGAEPIAKLARYTDRPDWVFRRPATTVVADPRLGGPGRSEFVKGGVSRQDRPGSLRLEAHEAATLQSYPAGFPFQGSKGKQFLQIGNAVPPVLGMAVLRAALSGVLEEPLAVAA